MQKYRHLELKKDNTKRVLNQCPFKNNHKNGALIYIGGLTCKQCKMYHGIDDDGNIVCGFGVDNITKKKNDDTYHTENNEKK